MTDIYFRVADGVVVGVLRALPARYENVSGFDALSDADRIAMFGVYPGEEVRPALASISVDTGEVDGNGDPILRSVLTQSFGAVSDEIQPDRVVRRYSVVDRNPADIAAEWNAPVLRQIAAIETSKIRPLTDVALGAGDVVTGFDNKTPRQRLGELETQLASLRARLYR